MVNSEENQGEKSRESISKTDREVKRPKLIPSVRLLLSSMCFLAVFNVSYVRIGISMAIVCMVTPHHSLHHNSEIVENRVGEFNWSTVTIGYLTSAVFYGFVLGPAVAGFLSFKYGGKLILVLGTFLCAAGHFFIPEATRLTPILFFVIRIFTGFFGSFIFPACYDLQSHWIVPEEQQLLVGSSLSGIPLACILNFPINSWVCSAWGWTWIFYILGIWMIAWGTIFIFTVYDYAHECPFISAKELAFLNLKIGKSQKSKIPWKNIFVSLPIYAYIVMHFSVHYVHLSLVLSLPLLMKEVYDFSLKENGMLSATPFMGSFVTRILICLFFEQLRSKLNLSKNAMRKIFTSLGATFVAIFLVITMFLSCSYQYWALGCLIVASCSLELCVTGGYLLSLLDLCPNYVNVLTGIANSIGSSAGLICPLVNGWLTSTGTKEEWDIVFYVIITVLLCATVFYLAFGQSRTLYWGLSSMPVSGSLSNHQEK